MKVQRKISPTVIIEAEGNTVAELFEALSGLEEVFHGHEVCGLCAGHDIRCQTRNDKEGNKYYQMVCCACGGEFRFGQRKGPGGVLFPQFKDKDGNVKPNGGWAKWEQNIPARQ